MHRLNLGLAAAVASCSIIGSAFAQTTVGVGVEHTTGKYGGSESTDTLYVPFQWKHETGPWVFRATVPWIRISGPANVIGAGAERVALPGASAGRRTESGLGDVVASAFYNIADERRSGLGIDLGAKVKLPTADEERGLGTGETDYALQADLFKQFGSVTGFASVGYRFYGDPPGLNLRNVPYYAIGGSYRLNADSSVGAAYDYRPRIVNGGSEISEATLFYSRRLSREWRVQLYTILGFSDASPDAGLGAVLDYRF